MNGGVSGSENFGDYESIRGLRAPADGSAELRNTLLTGRGPPAACPAGVTYVTVGPAATFCGSLDLGMVRALEKGN